MTDRLKEKERKRLCTAAVLQLNHLNHCAGETEAIIQARV